MGGVGSGRRPELRITDIGTHPKRRVGLGVAADYLGLSVATVRARIEEGRLQAVRDGKVILITLDALRSYDEQRRAATF